MYTDFEKAFDRVDHKLLIKKIESIGFNNPLVSWVNSFLTNRTQIVTYENFTSNRIKVLSGLPQGDHLSPLLLSLFINYIVTVLKHSECLLFADDTKLFKKVKCIEDSNNFQVDLDNFYKWCYENGMTQYTLTLNINKCSTVSIR